MDRRRKRSRNGVAKAKDRKSKETLFSVSDSCPILELPIPVVHEIFFKLPTKSIMRCKCVCKAWNSLISEPNFSTYYAKNSPSTSIICYTRENFVPNLLEISENGDCTSTPFNPNLSVTKRVSLVGYCNGFLCMLEPKIGTEVVYVTNPLTGLTVTLPECGRDGYGRVVLYVFGFSPSMNRFKVLRVCYRCVTTCSIKRCEIVTVGFDDAWRRLPVASFTGFSYFSDILAVNGAFHWIRNDEVGVVSTFDLTGENFGRIPTPPASLLPNSARVKLAAYGDQLSLVVSSGLLEIAIWKMKRYPVVESWTKVVVLTIWPPRGRRFNHPIPLAELRNGDFVLRASGHLKSYSIKHKKWYEIQVPAVGNLRNFSRPAYTPNFSSPWIVNKRHENAASDISQSSSR